MAPLWCRFCDPAGFEACPCTALEPERLRFGAGSAIMVMPSTGQNNPLILAKNAARH